MMVLLPAPIVLKASSRFLDLPVAHFVRQGSTLVLDPRTVMTVQWASSLRKARLRAAIVLLVDLQRMTGQLSAPPAKWVDTRPQESPCVKIVLPENSLKPLNLPHAQTVQQASMSVMMVQQCAKLAKLGSTQRQEKTNVLHAQQVNLWTQSEILHARTVKREVTLQLLARPCVIRAPLAMLPTVQGPQNARSVLLGSIQNQEHPNAQIVRKERSPRQIQKSAPNAKGEKIKMLKENLLARNV
jgi:hypothetical protein